VGEQRFAHPSEYAAGMEILKERCTNEEITLDEVLDEDTLLQQKYPKTLQPMSLPQKQTPKNNQKTK